MRVNRALELIDTFKAIIKLNNEFKFSLSIDDYVEALFIDGLIEIEEIKVICDCIKLVEKLQGKLKLDDINLICKILSSTEKIKANIDLIDIGLKCEYLKTLEKISFGINKENINLKTDIIRTKEKIKSLVKQYDINMTVKELLLTKWKYIFEIEDLYLTELEVLDIKNIERIII